MVGYPLQHNLAPYVLQDDYLGGGDDDGDDDTEASHRVLGILLVALSTKTLTHILSRWVDYPYGMKIICYSLRGSGSSWMSPFPTPSCWVGWGEGGRGGPDLDEWHRWKNRGGGREGRRSRHTRCTFMEIHCNFCPKVFSFHFSKNVSVYYQPSFQHLPLFQCPDHRRVRAIQESEAVLSPLNTSARLSNVNLVSDTASSACCSSSSSSCSEPLISINSYSVNSSAALPPLHAISTVSVLISLADSVTNPVKACTTPGLFSWVGIYCFGLSCFFLFLVTTVGSSLV